MPVANSDFDSVTDSLVTKSDKIRALARQGATTAEIARYLGIRYQHARNVLVRNGMHTLSNAAPAATHAHSEATTGDPSIADARWMAMDAAGRIQIPDELARLAGIAGGEPVYVSASDGRIEILSRRGALRRAHEIAARFVPDGASLVDDLLAERRREGAGE